MKSLLLFAVCLLCTGALNAQTFVSTSAENKNVVLEEFTGIHCTFCPDGHVRAQNMHNNNPNDVVLINIHVGSFASPSAGEPDFRTSFGTAIDGQANVTGYPAGTINRRAFPNTGPSSNPSGTGQGNCGTCTAMSRGYWQTIGNTVMAEASPVNVANQSSIDLATGQLTSVSEVYYTGNSATTTNRLNVALLQNNVPGPQTGGSTYNPAAILPNGDYNHQHMLRHLLSGQWGDAVTPTTTGSFVSVPHNYTIPANYLGVATNYPEMYVVVFVAEGQQVITTGAEGAMTYNMPPTAFDVSTTGGNFGMTGTTNYCSNGAWTPSFSTTNETANVVTSIEAQYTINGGTAVPFTLSGLNLAQGQSTTVTFPAVSLPAGNNAVEYSIVSLNGTETDILASNNNDLSGAIAALTASPTATTLSENFDTAPLPAGTWQYTQTMPGLVFENPNNLGENVFCVFGENSTSANISNCIRAQTASSAWNNLSGAVVFDNINLSANAAPGLTFDYAHALWTAGVGDATLEVFISTNCGSTWTSVWSRTGTNLATGAPVSGANFYPTPVTDWGMAAIDLSAYANQASVAVKFAFSKGTSGNNIYVDNINFDVLSTTTAIESVNSLAIMPNPVRDIMNVVFSVEEASDLNIAIYNTLGQQVQQVAAQNFVGENTLTVNTNNLAAGVYLLNITSATGTKTERFVVEK